MGLYTAAAFDPAAPGAIGGTTPAAVTGTTITATTRVVVPAGLKTSTTLRVGTGAQGFYAYGGGNNLGFGNGADQVWSMDGDNARWRFGGFALAWSSNGNGDGPIDLVFSRVSAGLGQIGTTTANALGSLKLTDLFTNNAAALIKTNTTLTDGVGAGAGTITNAPAAGNPTKWIPINDNGTVRHVPAW